MRRRSHQREVSRVSRVAAREPRIFRALAAVTVGSVLPVTGGAGARVVQRMARLLGIQSSEPPFAMLMRHGFVIVVSDPLRDVRLARRLAPLRLTIQTRVSVLPVDGSSDVTASFGLVSTGLVARLMTAAAWPVVERVMAAALGRWLSAVAADAVSGQSTANSR